MKASGYRVIPQIRLSFEDLIIDNFAGGGGASTGIEAALGRPVDVAINHDPDAIAMHTINHPGTKHYCENVWDIDPREVARGRPVALAWFSPDCKHFSKAKGGRPVEKNIRGLAWVAVRYAATVKPRVIILENVEEFKTWGPLVDDRPCPRRKGKTFGAFVRALERLGYNVETNTLRASDYGVPTIRKRLFLVARRDRLPVVWPKPTHGDPALPGFKESGLKPWVPAADIINWSLPCPSIFERKRPLAENTLRRIARGIDRYVLNSATPFIVTCNHGGDSFRGQAIDKPMRTITAAHDAHGVVVPTLIQTGYGERQGQAPRVPGLDKPLGTVVAGGSKHALVTAFMAKHFGGNYNGPGADMGAPLPTVTAVDHNALVAAHLINLKGSDRRDQPATRPAPAICAGGLHVGEVRAFLVKYYSEGGQWQDMGQPLHTIPTKDRLGLVTVHGQEYQIVDIGMRMLTPAELFRAQGFPPDYVIDRDAEGNQIAKYKQVARCGNSVPPAFAEALVRANLIEVARKQAAA